MRLQSNSLLCANSTQTSICKKLLTNHVTRTSYLFMIIPRKILIYFIFACTGTCFASNLQTSNLADIKNLLDKEAGKETLVIFDIDDVLITPTDEFAITDPIRKKLSKGHC
jgi:hypothetical protein